MTSRSSLARRLRSSRAKDAARRRRGELGPDLPPGFAYDNPWDRNHRWHSASTGRFAKKRKTRRGRKSSARRNPSKMYNVGHMGARDNPFDRLGLWHGRGGKFRRPPSNRRMAAKRSRHAAKMIKGRKRVHGVLANPFTAFDNPFKDRAGRWHRNDGPFSKYNYSKSRGRRRRTARDNPSMAYDNPRHSRSSKSVHARLSKLEREHKKIIHAQKSMMSHVRRAMSHKRLGSGR